MSNRFRSHRPLATSIETALPVESVSEEYQWLRAHACVCGYWGNVQVLMQCLLEVAGRYYDRLDTKCSACGLERSYYFDVTELFNSYSRLVSDPEGEPDESEAGD